MKTSVIMGMLLCLVSFASFSQEAPTPTGYKLRPTTGYVYVYKDSLNAPLFKTRNRWSYKYWFVIDDTTHGRYIDKKTKVKYARITIPSSRWYKDSSGKWIEETEESGYGRAVKWEQEELIDGSDFNTWLWIREDDLKLKDEYYRGIKRQFVLSGLTAPFKFRPAIGERANSIINGDINLGSFIGMRFFRGLDLGVSAGGYLGVSSIALNASNNTAIFNKDAETIQGFIYGYGLVLDVKRQFQIGLIGGFDYGIGSLAKTYVHQNANWFAFSLNYKFLDFGNKDSGAKKAGEPNAKAN